MHRDTTQKIKNKVGSQKSKSIFGSIIKGVIAGGVATLAMDQIGKMIFRRQSARSMIKEQQARMMSNGISDLVPGKLSGAMSLLAKRPGNMERTFSGVKHAMARKPYSSDRSVHFMGAILPAIGYAILRKRVPKVGAARGLLYGLGVFALVEEGLMPLIGQNAKPRNYPWQTHARGLGTHLIYGLVTDSSLRGLDMLQDRAMSMRERGGDRFDEQEVGGQRYGESPHEERVNMKTDEGEEIEVRVEQDDLYYPGPPA